MTKNDTAMLRRFAVYVHIETQRQFCMPVERQLVDPFDLVGDHEIEGIDAPLGRYFRRSDIVEAATALTAANLLGAHTVPIGVIFSEVEDWYVEVYYLSPYCYWHIVFRGEDPPQRSTYYFQVYGVEEINGSREDDAAMVVYDDAACPECLEDLIQMVLSTPGAALRTAYLTDVEVELAANGQPVYSGDMTWASVVPTGVLFAPPDPVAHNVAFLRWLRSQVALLSPEALYTYDHVTTFAGTFAVSSEVLDWTVKVSARAHGEEAESTHGSRLLTVTISDHRSDDPIRNVSLELWGDGFPSRLITGRGDVFKQVSSVGAGDEDSEAVERSTAISRCSCSRSSSTSVSGRCHE